MHLILVPRHPAKAKLSIMATTILDVQNLHVRYANEAGSLHAVRGVSFSLLAGETLALVGESGSGKSATAMAIMGLQPDSASVVSCLISTLMCPAVGLGHLFLDRNHHLIAATLEFVWHLSDFDGMAGTLKFLYSRINEIGSLMVEVHEREDTGLSCCSAHFLYCRHMKLQRQNMGICEEKMGAESEIK